MPVVCYGLKDETAVRKKTDVPSAASVDGVDKTGDVSNAPDKGIRTSPLSSSATDSVISQRKGRGKSILNAVNDVDVSMFIVFICELFVVILWFVRVTVLLSNKVMTFFSDGCIP